MWERSVSKLPDSYMAKRQCRVQPSLRLGEESGKTFAEHGSEARDKGQCYRMLRLSNPGAFAV
jgi:hypothetical protein